MNQVKMGDVVIVKGYRVSATGSDEDPGIVNSVVMPKVEGMPILISATMFPEGANARNVRSVPIFPTKSEALVAHTAQINGGSKGDASLVAFFYEPDVALPAVK